jgi:hypothetical protein
MCTFRRELLGHRSAETFAARCHECDFAAKTKVHC